jgi:hypothetical protein
MTVVPQHNLRAGEHVTISGRVVTATAEYFEITLCAGRNTEHCDPNSYNTELTRRDGRFAVERIVQVGFVDESGQLHDCRSEACRFQLRTSRDMARGRAAYTSPSIPVALAPHQPAYVPPPTAAPPAVA